MVKNRLFSSTHLIIILCVGCFIMFGMCFRCFYNCFSKLRADHSVYQVCAYFTMYAIIIINKLNDEICVAVERQGDRVREKIAWMLWMIDLRAATLARRRCSC